MLITFPQSTPLYPEPKRSTLISKEQIEIFVPVQSTYSLEQNPSLQNFFSFPQPEGPELDCRSTQRIFDKNKIKPVRQSTVTAF